MDPVASRSLGSDGPSQQIPPLWGTLCSGAYAVGCNSTLELDWSRAYDAIFEDETAYTSGKAPRPILVNIWYPALSPFRPFLVGLTPARQRPPFRTPEPR
jgi:hypothetical protein